MNTTAHPQNTRLDVREVDCSSKRELIFERWLSLQPGEHFVLVNHHDPVPMYYMLSGQFPEQVNWEYEERTAEYVAIRITKVGAGIAFRPFTPPQGAATSCGHSHADDDASVIELDARGLEPPEPMMRILSAVERIAAGQTVRAFTDRRPIMLLADLQSRGLHVSSTEQSNGSWLTVIEHA
ncbi:MAG: DUF2249 domain-containing protein [Opitutae bacterium]|nr:DUF2249 domain-containing protein [Opitutae bacterium]